MSESDNHIDELNELLVRLFEQAIYDGASNTSSIFDERNKGKVIPYYAQKLADNATQLIEDFYKNKIPEKRKGLPSYDGWSMSAIDGYNKAVDDITTKFNSKDKK